jgi:ElaB/YqjD/DUF883 family membrane-anchored ribosome-binding protein
MNTTAKSLSDDASKLAQQGMDSLSSAGKHANTAMHQAAHDTSELAHRGMDALREGSADLRESGQHARQYTTDHIRHDPIKSVLIAAAVGAGLMGLLTMVSHLSGDHRSHRGSGQ